MTEHLAKAAEHAGKAVQHTGTMMMTAGTAGYMMGQSMFKRLLTNPLVMFAAGAAVGYYGFKYRKEIAAAVAKASDMGRDFVLEQKEKLSDMVEETREAEEGGAAKAKK
ncbi:MAG: hypothetical protein H7841_07200 [Magnetospirillum sp. WYHS-4]